MRWHAGMVVIAGCRNGWMAGYRNGKMTEKLVKLATAYRFSLS
ncbi:MAG: hypothetical protein V9E86_05215 [Nitrosomonas sp.]|nr:hypothetical protein [Nitrosomonas sp.]